MRESGGRRNAEAMKKRTHVKKDGVKLCEEKEEMHRSVQLPIRSESQSDDRGKVVEGQPKVFDQKILLNHCDEIGNKIT